MESKDTLFTRASGNSEAHVSTHYKRLGMCSNCHDLILVWFPKGQTSQTKSAMAKCPNCHCPANVELTTP